MMTRQEPAAIELLARMIDKHGWPARPDRNARRKTQDTHTRSLVLRQYIDALMDSLNWSPLVKRECREFLAAHDAPRRRRPN